MIERKLYPPWRACLFGLLAALLLVPWLRADEMMRQVQEELRKRHLYFGDIDGRYTPEVAAALRRYQQGKGFPPDGTPDEVTLRSLTLLPPAPADHSLSPLPDITVLRSDEGLSQDRAASVVPGSLATAVEPGPTTAPLSTPTPTPAPSQPTLAAQRPTPQAVCAFVAAYLRAGQTNDPEAELHFYGEHVDYFEDGVVDQRFLAQDVSKYDHHWPQRQFSLSGAVEVKPASSDGDPVKTGVRFRYRWAVKNNRYSLVGQTDTEYVVAGSRPEDFRIVSMKEQRVRP